MLATSPQISLDEALAPIEAIVKRSQADGVFASLTASESSLTRFSENQIGQHLSRNRCQLTVTSYFDRRSASASTTELDEEAIAATVERSELLARIAPEDPEWVPLLEPPNYSDRTPAFDEATAQLSAIARGEIVRDICQQCQNADVEGSGTFSTRVGWQAIGNSLGLRACDRGTEAAFALTARRGTGSSWNQRTAFAVADLPIAEISEQVISRALSAQNPREILPGVYPTILDAAAFADLLPVVIWNLDARAADEGRSFMSRIDDRGEAIGNRLGETLFSPLVQVWRDPAHPLLQSGRFFGDGMPNTPREIIVDGVPQTLAYSRYWAQKQGKTPTGDFHPIAMQGSDRAIEELIAETERGIFVSRAWYVRYVNPRKLEVTGMTRDGTFWIENGQLAYPIKNLRFNQELPAMLKAIDAVSRPQRFRGSVVPGVRVGKFRFSSITDSI